MARNVGSGPCRIGLPIVLGEDIYSMLYVSCITSHYLYYFAKVAGTESDLPDEDEDASLNES